MPIVTINDLKAKSASKRGKKMGIATVNDGEYLQLGKGNECIESKTRKAEKQDKDGDIRDEHEEDTDKSLGEARTPGKMKQKHGSGEEADGNENVYLKLTPRQMAALPWANRDFSGAALEVNKAAVRTEQDEGINGSHVAGANEQGGGEVKAGADCDDP